MYERPVVEPLLKWAGGKRWLVPRLQNYYVNKNYRLVDPFVGAMSVPLGLRPDKCLVSDVNPHLMNLYRWLQHGLVWEEDDGIEWDYSSVTFYENRSKFNSLCSARQYWTKEGALLFYYLNRTCFNGLCRFNKDGEFNVPFGRHKHLELKKDFRIYQMALKDWQLYSGDFESLPLEPGDFVYADPPYDVEFTQFAPRDFVWGDQERLAKWLAAHQGPVIASNSHTPRIVSLYQSLNFKVYSVEAPRSISCTGDRTPELEILALKNL